MIKLRNEGLLCCHSSYIFSKYFYTGHLIISSSFSTDDLYADALTVVFSSRGASTVSFGVVNVNEKALRCVQLHFK